MKTAKKAIFKCDHASCGKEYERYLGKLGTSHFCSRECAHKEKKLGGLINLAAQATWQKTLGCDNSLKSLKVREAGKKKLIELFGVDNYAKSEQSRAECRSRNDEKFKELREEKKRRKLQKQIDRAFDGPLLCKCDGIGCDAVFFRIRSKMSSSFGNFCSRKCSANHPSVLKQIEVSVIQSTGTKHPRSTVKARQAAKHTMLSKYGVENPFQLEKAKIATATPAACRARHETMKKNGNYARKSSFVEEEFLQCLVGLFIDVKHHEFVHKWDVDFYVKSIDTFIQFDGVYWHGLDRPIEVIGEFRNPRDRTIHATFFRDRLQDEYFRSSNLKLIRFTDREFKNWKKLGIELEEIMKRLTNG